MRLWATLAISVGVMVGGEDELRFGAVALSGHTPCVAFVGSPVPKGTTAVVVTPGVPQRVLSALVEEALESCEVLQRAAVDGPYYRLLLLSHPNPESRLVGVAIVGLADVSALAESVTLRAPHSSALVAVRSCTSHEGLHLTAWAGKPLTGRRLWHTYWYLGYDVDPSCEERDWK